MNVLSSEIFPLEFIVYCQRQVLAKGIILGNALLTVQVDLDMKRLDLTDLSNINDLLDMVGCKWYVTHTTYFLFMLDILTKENYHDLDTFLQSFEIFLEHKSNVLVISEFNVTNNVNSNISVFNTNR